jgi:hypothetical protein
MRKGLGKKAEDEAKEFTAVCIIALAVFVLGLFTTSPGIFATFAGLVVFFGFLRGIGFLGD